jgi:hypothetical protein
MKALRTSETARSEFLDAVKKVPKEKPDEPPNDEWLWRKAIDAYHSANVDDLARRLGAELQRSFRRQIVLRMLTLAIGAAALFGVLVYCLAWATVPVDVSSRWISHPVDMAHVELIGWSIAMPVGPYISLAVLMSIVATAAFLAFSLAEDRYATTLSGVLVRRQAELWLMLAVPFRRIYKP